jgi:hypothetical protein
MAAVSNPTRSATLAQHDQQHQTQRREAGEGLGHLGQQRAQVLRRQQALGGQNLMRDGVCRADAQRRADHAGDDHAADQPEENEHRVRQTVAETLHGVEDADSERTFGHGRHPPAPPGIGPARLYSAKTICKCRLPFEPLTALR